MTSEKIHAIAKQYFTSWKARYKKQTDPAYAAKQEEKEKLGRVRDRRIAKCNRRKAMTAKFDKQHATEGSARFVQPAFQSPEHSDCGEASRPEWELYRQSVNGGTGGLETRPLLYRATWVSPIFSTAQTRKHTHLVSQLTRLLYALDKLAEDQPGPGMGKSRYQRWHGLPVNAVNQPPSLGKGDTNYICMYGPEWLASNQPKKAPKETPENFTMSEVDIPDTEIRSEDLRALQKN